MGAFFLTLGFQTAQQFGTEESWFLNVSPGLSVRGIPVTTSNLEYEVRQGGNGLQSLLPGRSTGHPQGDQQQWKCLPPDSSSSQLPPPQQPTSLCRLCSPQNNGNVRSPSGSMPPSCTPTSSFAPCELSPFHEGMPNALSDWHFLLFRFPACFKWVASNAQPERLPSPQAELQGSAPRESPASFYPREDL